MNSQNSSQSEDRDSSHAGLKCALALLVLVGLMIGSYFYPYSNGKRPDVSDLLMFWGREALLVALALAGLAFLAVAAIVNAIRKRGEPDA
jgi:hypothetical protein